MIMSSSRRRRIFQRSCDRPARFATTLTTYATSAPGSEQRQKAEEQLDTAVEAKRRRQPQNRHDDRCSGLYVDLAGDGKGWRRPVAVDRSEALHEINSAVSDYNIERQNLLTEELAPVLRDRRDLALDQMTRARAKLGEIEIPAAVWPREMIAAE
jgi:hypothetical protein